jgi:VanZ family protein
MPSQRSHGTKLLRAFFILYALALLTATHWPGLAVKGPFNRMDLVIHCGAFGLWTLMLGLTGWIRSTCCVRRQALIVGLIGIAFGWIDESTQPMFSRVFDWLDIAADMTGAIGASIILFIIYYKQNGGQCHITPDSVA